MSFDFWLILLIVHIILFLIYLYLILSGISYLRREFVLLILAVPFFGLLAAIIIDLLNRSGEEGKKPIDMLPLSLESDILWKSLKNVDEEGNIIPLEEALLINDNKTRREMMLDTLYHDPMNYLDILMIARHNEDVETSHYATTVISQSQRNYQVEIQKLSSEIDQHTDDVNLLDKYIDLLGTYIQSGLLEEYLLKNQRIVYSEILDQKLSIKPRDKHTLILKLRNHLELQEFSEAYETVGLLQYYWPKDEQTWVESIRVFVESRDEKKLKETIREIKSLDIDWTIKGKEQLNFWLEGDLV